MGCSSLLTQGLVQHSPQHKHKGAPNGTPPRTRTAVAFDPLSENGAVARAKPRAFAVAARGPYLTSARPLFRLGAAPDPKSAAEVLMTELVIRRAWPLADINRDQWRAFWAVFLGWLVDAFDFNMLAFVLLDIQRGFSVDRALAGALGTVTLAMRLVGSGVAGVLADRYGRKLPLMLSVLWLSLFAALSGCSTSYATLFALRALFGLGMGGEWAAGMPLVLEHWPARYRGLASGLLQGGWYWGYLLSAIVFQYVYPLFAGLPDLGWRAMLWTAVAPALLAVWIRRRVKESPVWLEHRQAQAAGPRAAGEERRRLSLWRLFDRELLGSTVQTAAVISAFMCFYYSVNFWYPTLLREAGRPTLPYLAAFNFGAIAGTALCGRLSETRLGRRGAATTGIVLAIAALPLYLQTADAVLLFVGALLLGMCGAGIWGIAPAYTSERFPTSVRGVGPGFCYHVGAVVGALMPWLLGAMQDHGVPIATAIRRTMLAAGLAAVVCLWLGPETRGRVFAAGSRAARPR
jgi:MFS transporter, SHS family, lactate transporter